MHDDQSVSRTVDTVRPLRHLADGGTRETAGTSGFAAPLTAPPAVLAARNAARPAPVPDAAVQRMISRWEAPDTTEAHAVSWIDTR